MTSPKPITLEEQIEAVEFHAGIRSVPADYSSAHEYAALRAAAATLRSLAQAPPREPTNAMVNAGAYEEIAAFGSPYDAARAIWRVMYDAALAERDRPNAPDVISGIWEAIGRYSIEICRPDAELAPPQYLLDAVQRARDRIATLESELARAKPVLDAARDAQKYYVPTDNCECVRCTLSAAIRALDKERE